jgi:mannose/cellobiose epimerase-like protein (N-acyl-D-glucosamine 2-epimerase family)
VCPFWLERLTHPTSGFFEAMLAGGAPQRGRIRTTLVQARLTYTFSHALVMSDRPAFRAAAEHGFAFLSRVLRAPGGDGFFRSADEGGSPVDQTRDTYDHAFVLLAMAGYYRATRQREALDVAEATVRFLEEHLADERHGGFAEELAGRDKGRLPRRQNPHMHLLEACLALFAATQEEAWLQRCRSLVELFQGRFVDVETGALIEYFAHDWSPSPGSQGRWREPGHQFEWVWLLFEYLRHSGDESVVPWTERLFQFGTRFGIEREGPLRGAVLDGVGAAGEVVAATKLLWPQTEYLKACVARAEWHGDAQARSAIRSHLALMAKHFFRLDGATWHNQLAPDGTPVDAPTPARVLYHLFLAVAEADRLYSARE